ncbi:hypothetical protein C4580_01080 [Candidatus Woesearchaeota archaeon]|nr:MAG: hypothetical protein C4580_01080 [Candidatus Woesearchaeota archaeon]
MINVYLHGPSWFLGVDAALEALAAFIALLVTLASYRTYCATQERRHGYFTLSLGLLTLSFLSRSIADSLLRGIFITLSETTAALIFFAGYVIHIMLAFIAYIILVCITHKISDKRIAALLFMTLIPGLLLSGSYYRSFYGLSFIFLAFITFAYYQNHRQVKTRSSSLVFEAFGLLAAAQIQFLIQGFYILPGDWWNTLFVTAHVTQALGYLFLLFALLRTRLVTNETRKNRHRV